MPEVPGSNPGLCKNLEIFKHHPLPVLLDIKTNYYLRRKFCKFYFGQSRIVSKNTGIERTKFGNSVLVQGENLILRREIIILKNLTVENCKRGNPSGALKIQFVAGFGEDPLETFTSVQKSISRKNREVLSSFANARKYFWLKQGLEPATAGFPLNRLSSVPKMVHTE